MATITTVAAVPRVSASERRKRATGRLLVWPAAIWLLFFFVFPLIIVLIYSFLTPDSIFQVRGPLTINNYVRLTQPTYTGVIWRSLQTALVTTIISVLVGYPLAWFISTRPKETRNLFLLMVVIPFWTNFLVRTYAWLFILNDNGLINSIVKDYLHLVDTPIQLVNTSFAVTIGLVYGYLPFMVLPIYTSLEKLNFRLIEAVYDLGGNDWQAFWRVVLPLTLPGVLAGCVLVFIPALGAFVTPDLLGGAKALMMATQVNDAVSSPTGKPFGSALSIVLMALVSIALLIYFRFADRSETAL
ncbi:MAG: ABC transporter permease [Chloroflexota bacterium]